MRLFRILTLFLALAVSATWAAPTPQAKPRGDVLWYSHADGDGIAQVGPKPADLQSIGVRRTDRSLLLHIGPHEAWRLGNDDSSNDAEIQVPLSHDGERWGQLELRFAPLRHEGWLGYLDDPTLRLTAFMGLCGVIVFALYLGRMLRHLDPSQAIPARVRSALDTLTEGLMVLDAKCQTVLANQSLAAIIGEDPDALLGEMVDRLTDTRLGWVGEGQQAPDRHVDLVGHGEVLLVRHGSAARLCP